MNMMHSLENKYTLEEYLQGATLAGCFVQPSENAEAPRPEDQG